MTNLEAHIKEVRLAYKALHSSYSGAPNMSRLQALRIIRSTMLGEPISKTKKLYGILVSRALIKEVDSKVIVNLLTASGL